MVVSVGEERQKMGFPSNCNYILINVDMLFSKWVCTLIFSQSCEAESCEGEKGSRKVGLMGQLKIPLLNLGKKTESIWL